MNANELADKAESVQTWEYGTTDDWIEQAATMLRQQEVEIERITSKHEEMLRQQQAEIEALKAGKIRAYDNGVEDGRKPNTNPVKELTREDRLKLIGTLKWAEDLLREAGHDEAVDEVQDCIMLLRKAQENG